MITLPSVIDEYHRSGKTPLLIVGGNNWFLNKIPYKLNDYYDFYFVFYSSNQPFYTIGLYLFPTGGLVPLFLSKTGTSVSDIIESLISEVKPDEEFYDHETLKLWTLKYLMRCPKMPLQDALHLENYPTLSLQVKQPSISLFGIVNRQNNITDSNNNIISILQKNADKKINMNSKKPGPDGTA